MGFTLNRIPGKARKDSSIVIAASNSPSYLKSQADYVATGVSDQNIINTAINQLPSAGGKIKLLEGTFNIDNNINLVSNCTLQGQGPGTFIKAAIGSPTAILMINISSKENVYVDSLCIDCSNIADSRGINIASSSNILISRCLVKNAVYAAIRTSYCNFSQMVNNAIVSSAIGIRSDIHTNSNIIGNFISTSDRGLLLNYADYTIISKNTITNSTQQDGIYMAYSSYNIISNNTIYNCSDRGIEMAISNFNIVSNNLIKNSSRGMDVRTNSNGNIVSNNIFLQSQGHGLIIWDTSKNNSIHSNFIDSSSQASSNSYSDIVISTNANYNNVQNNTCRVGGLTNKPKYGLVLADAGCIGNVVTNNDLYNSGLTANFLDLGTGTVTAAGNRL